MVLSDRERMCWVGFDPGDVRTREGSRGTRLSYADVVLITDRLNEVFGPAGWTTGIEKLEVTGPVMARTSSGEKEYWTAYCVLRLQIHAEGFIKESSDVGFGDGWGRDGVELAVKEARSDALKRCAKDLGPAFALGLWDKDNPIHNGGQDSWGRVMYSDAGHHPDWERAKGRFFVELARLGHKYEDVKGMCVSLGKPKPSALCLNDLKRLLEGLSSPAGVTKMAAYMAAKEKQ
jgi:hypothetical protein